MNDVDVMVMLYRNYPTNFIIAVIFMLLCFSYGFGRLPFHSMYINFLHSCYST